MAKVHELTFSVGQRRNETWRELERVVGRLTEIDDEQQHLEQLMLHLQRRRNQLEREWAELLPVRDQLELDAWENSVRRMEVEEAAALAGPKPPALPARPAPVLAELAGPSPESWDFAEAPEAVPVWVSPVKTWPLPIPGLVPSRANTSARRPPRPSSASVAGPARRRTAATSPAGR